MKISSWLYRISHGWLVLAAVVVFVLFMVFVLPAQAAKADETAQGAGSPDTSFFYSPGALFDMAEAYGQDGRQEEGQGPKDQEEEGRASGWGLGRPSISSKLRP